MSSTIFHIKEHILPCQHIREYPRATANSQEEVLHLAIKQYIPIDNPNPQPGDVTIIGAHANGFPKELYEPLWEELHQRSKAAGFRIRSIWIADVAHQGMSSKLNEYTIGDDPNWNDHARDLLHMVNTFRAEMPLPLVGVGHSFGGCQLVQLALLHPRLMTTLVLLDPVILKQPGAGTIAAKSSTFRRDIWPSRADAEAAFAKQKFLKAWDRRVFDRWLKFGLQDTPTALYPDERGVTLSTTKHQEVFTFFRPNYGALTSDGNLPRDRNSHPDIDLNAAGSWFGYRPESGFVIDKLPSLRPSVLYIFGEKSDVSDPARQQEKMEITGTGVGGSGGAKEGRVKRLELKGMGHLFPMEAVADCADGTASWIAKELSLWAVEDRKYREWTKLSQRAKITMSEDWIKRVEAETKIKAKI